MDIARITSGEIKAALERIRQAKPIGDNDLLAMDALTVRLREDGLDDNPESREWALQALLYQTVVERLAALRGEPVPGETDGLGDDDHAQLADDFSRDDIELEAWSSLYHRFLTPGRPLQMRQLAEVALPGYRGRSGERQVHRRMTRGLKALERLLRDREAAAGREVASRPGVHPRERIQVGTDAAAAAPSADDTPEAALLAAVRDEARVVTLGPSALEQIAQRPADDLTAWRLSRVAAWSRPRYRLDERFVALTLLVDRGERATAERWHTTERHADLRAVMADRPELALVVLGPPGSGKSTLLRRLELDEAIAGLRGESERVPFLMPLGLYPAPPTGGAPPSPRDWLAGAWAARNPVLPELGALLAEGRMLLLLDGLNEMPHADAAGYRAGVAAWRGFLGELAQLAPGNRVVFSCRSLDYSAPLSTTLLRVPHVRVERLTDAQVRRFLRVHSPARGEALWSALKDTPTLELVRTPYVLELLLEQAWSDGTVANGRAGLFTGFVRAALRREIERGNRLFEPNGLLAERDYRRLVQARAWGTPHALPARGALVPGLETLAHRMQARRAGAEKGQVRLPYDRACALLEDPEAEEILAGGRALGVLDEDPGRDEVMFFHQLLQEYFAARRVARQLDVARVARRWRAAEVAPSVGELLDELPATDPLPPLPATGWEETTVLAAAMAESSDRFVADLMSVRLALAGRCAAEPDVRTRLPDARVAELRRALIARGRDPKADLRARIAAGLALGRLGDPRLVRSSGPDGTCLVPETVEIAGGRYPIGRQPSAEDSGGGGSASPVHEVVLERFSIGRFPVTNAEYARFIDAGGYEDERWWDTPDARAWRRGETTADGARAAYRRWRARFRADPAELESFRERGQMTEEIYQRWVQFVALSDAEWEARLEVEWPGGAVRRPRYWDDPDYGNPAQPVVGVCWYEARAYCAWLAAQTGRSFRLPTEIEWEATARGREGRRYAYGDTFDPLRANGVATRIRRTTPVGVFPEGDTPQGVADLTGNASEWTSSLFGPADDPEHRFRYPYDPTDGREDPRAPPEVDRVHRGGAWDYAAADLAAAKRWPFRPEIRHDYVGFRVACDDEDPTR